MPLYAYRCPQCGAEHERRVPAEERDGQLCDTRFEYAGIHCACPLVRKFAPTPHVLKLEV